MISVDVSQTQQEIPAIKKDKNLLIRTKKSCYIGCGVSSLCKEIKKSC